MTLFNMLLVDDEKPFVEELAIQLRQKGFFVDLACSGAQALDHLAATPIDVVVLDVRMPGLDGIETLKELKKKHPLVEVIMLTGHPGVQSAVDAIKLGAFDYLKKPCDLNFLVSKAEQAFERKTRREAQLFDVRVKIYITKQERDDLISRIMNS